MVRRIRAVKSEINNRVLKKYIKIERSKTPCRFSRRLRHLEPECTITLSNAQSSLKHDKSNITAILSAQSSFTLKTGHKKHHHHRKFKFPQSVRDSKEIISIFSAPKFKHKRQGNIKKINYNSELVRSTSFKPKTMKHKDCTCHMYQSSKCHTPIRKGNLDPEHLIESRKKYVLEVLNKGDMKDIEKLHTVGSKTAERILLYRQIKGSINKLSALSKIPQFPKQKYNKFMVQNFLKDE